jgi:hypothetical protein
MKNYRHAYFFLIAFVFTCLLSACSSTIPVSDAIIEPAKSRVPLEIGVELFDDDRGRYKNTGKACFVFPLMPFGWFYYEAPDKEPVGISMGPMLFSPQRETQDIFIAALKISKIFTKVHLISDPRKDKTGDLVVRGKIIKASQKEKFWSYGLSVPGFLFWFFGAPIITAAETYAIKVEIFRRGDPASSWVFQAEKEISVVQGIYYKSNEFDKPALAKDLNGKNYKCLRRYMAEVVAAEFIRALDIKLQNNPDLFKPSAGATPPEKKPESPPEKQ